MHWPNSYHWESGQGHTAALQSGRSAFPWKLQYRHHKNAVPTYIFYVFFICWLTYLYCLPCRTSSILSNCFQTTMTVLLCKREEMNLKDIRTQGVKGMQRSWCESPSQALRNIRAFPSSQRQGALSHILSFEQAEVANHSSSLLGF